MEIRYSFSLGETPAPPKAAFLCLDDCQTFDLPGGMVMLLGRYSGNRLAVTRDVFIALQACNVFRTLDEHVEYLIQRMPELAAQPADVKRVLESIRDAGLFIDAQRICEAVKAAAPAAPEPLTVVVLTCDRPAALDRLLKSMLPALNDGLVSRLLIIDDSRLPESLQANSDVLAALRASPSLPSLLHVHEHWRAEYLQRLIARLPEAGESIRFLLDAQRWPEHRRYGLGRNWALLLAAGSRLAMFDDDVLCDAVGPVAAGGVLAFAQTPRHAYERGAPDSLAVTVKSQNPLDLVGQSLGSSLGALVAMGSTGVLIPEQLRGAAVQDLIDLAAETPIIATACGTCGDPGTGPAADWLMGLPDECLQSLAQDEARLEQFLRSRDFWMGRLQPTLSTRFLMSGLTGLDARSILPPYFPVMRGEDLLFGCLLALMYPSARVLDFDWAVPHLPVESREHLGRVSVSLPGPSVALLEETLMSYAPLLSGTALQRMQQLAAAIGQLADSPTDSLLSVAEGALLERRVNGLKELVRRREQWPEAQSAWRQLVDEGIQRHQQSLSQAGLVSQLRQSAISSDAELIERFRSWAKGYADGLQRWPSVWQAVLAESDQIHASS